ncbi:MAG: hypothetical protein DRH57_05640 [Candidatus Cloacimonadota bacterium]|nr:MAG: hypothetical protein DRH57_05640 [Candidatus Cloacimonadota bacterium]
MDIKSDANTNFVTDEEVVKNKNTPKNDFIWLLILAFGGLLMWAALMSPEVKGIVAFFVFFIGLNRVDAAIDYFRGIDDKKPVGEKDIL